MPCLLGLSFAKEATMSSSSGTAPAQTDSRWPTTIASILVGLAFFAFWFWLLPQWLGLHAAAAQAQPWRWIFAIPSVLGFAVALRCVWDFGYTGRGTPAPIAPPQRL